MDHDHSSRRAAEASGEQNDESLLYPHGTDGKAFPLFEALVRHGPCLRALAAMRDVKGPMNMTTFGKLCGVSPEPAARARKRLAAWGFLEVEERRWQGKIVQMAIRLTPLGEEVARILAEASLRIEEAWESRPPGFPRQSSG